MKTTKDRKRKRTAAVACTDLLGRPRKPYWEAQQIIGIKRVEKLRAAGLMLIHKCDYQAMVKRSEATDATH